MDQTQIEGQQDRSRRLAASCLAASFCLLAMASGCSQSFWRKQADKDTYNILQEKQTDPRWVAPRTSLTPDPRSRFFDPYDPDKEPMPPDDPAAAADMDCPDGMPGYQGWHKYGRAMSVENPIWLANFEHTPEMIDETSGEYVCPVPAIQDLTILDAIELTYIHNRDYQFQLEETYFTALALTLERFQFQVRYLGIGGGEPGADLTYENVPGVQDSLRLNTNFGVSQLLPTGGQWAMELANNTLWLFSGPNAGTDTASVFSYRLVQPLLFNAGRKIALEGLTQTERDVLYAVRDLARFRKELFTDVVSSYLNLLQQLQGIRNQEYNIEQLERQVVELSALAKEPPGATPATLEEFPAGATIPESLREKVAYDADRGELIWFRNMSPENAVELLAISDDPQYQAAARELIALLTSNTTPLDVLQLESRLASAIINLQTSERRYQDSLDQFKIQLGLPPDMEMTIDDSALKQFELIDPVMTALRDEAEEAILIVGALDTENPDVDQARAALQQIESLYNRIMTEGVSLAEADSRSVAENLDSRLEGVTEPEVREQVIATVDRDRNQLDTLELELRNLGNGFARIRKYLEQGESDEESVKAAIVALTDLHQDLLQRAQGLIVVQVGMRSELINVNRYELGLDDSIGLALENRLDLMNQEGLVMDARRQVDVAANALKSNLDVVVAGDIRTEPGSGNPFDFSGRSSSHRVGVQFTAPLDQINERNIYRAAQVNYQRERRDYMEFEDTVKFQVRTAWRNLAVLEQNLETARQSLRINVLQYDQAVEASADPEATNRSGVSGRNLVDALDRILDSQDRLVQIWSDYEQTRLEIHRDMGIMEIDEFGMWIDPYYQEMYETQSRGIAFPEVCPPSKTTGDLDITLLPPGPNDHGYVRPGTDKHEDARSDDQFGIRDDFVLLPVPPVPAETEAPALVDPLRGSPGGGAGNDSGERDVQRRAVSGPEFYRRLGNGAGSGRVEGLDLVPVDEELD